jgi:hypothetical protein
MAPDLTNSVSSGPCKPDFYRVLFHYLNWTLILTADFSANLTRRTDFDSRLFRLPNLDTLVFTYDKGCIAGATDRQGMPTPPWHLIPPLIYSEVRSRPFSDLYFKSFRTYEIDYCSLFFSFYATLTVTRDLGLYGLIGTHVLQWDSNPVTRLIRSLHCHSNHCGGMTNMSVRLLKSSVGFEL